MVVSTFTGLGSTLDIASDIILNGGGTYAVERNFATGGVRVSRVNLKFGYMVSLPYSERQIPVESLTNREVGEYIGQELHELTKLTNYFGAWVEDGIVYLDVSQQVGTKNVALYRAVQGNQLAIFDNKHKSVITVTDKDREVYA